MKISEVMEKTGLTKRAIRYYEDEGFISPNINKENKYRDYNFEDVDKLIKVSLLRQIDLSINDIKEIMDKPLNFNKVLAKHLERIDENIERLQTSKNLISKIINNSETVDSENFIDELKELRNNMDFEDKQKFGYIKKQLQKIFPGVYGRMIILHFSPFLNEPVDSREKEKAWTEIIKFLDETESIKYPEEYEEIYNNFSEKDLEKFAEHNNERVRKLIDSSNEELEDYKKELIENIKSMQANKDVKEYRSKMSKINTPVREQLMESGYYEIFVKNLQILSKDYRKYQEVLNKLNDDLGLKYDRDGNIVFSKIDIIL